MYVQVHGFNFGEPGTEDAVSTCARAPLSLAGNLTRAPRRYKPRLRKPAAADRAGTIGQIANIKPLFALFFYISRLEPLEP